MKVVRKIAGKKLTDRVRSENIRRMCGIKHIKDWVLKRKQEWNEHINRMDENRLVRTARDTSPIGRRSVENHEQFIIANKNQSEFNTHIIIMS